MTPPREPDPDPWTWIARGVLAVIVVLTLLWAVSG
ncbi:hypothetical protein EDD28_2440 [Salana multivorans]|uniref:Uncharacterized protein n=1 Tax=Salana multivorans TaxID=120377 RepID=A0A3N2DDH4_9MICO|nr:hypothetical protein EDD28_3461 [Salana multivorans]ROR97831.1 hypothetical protein EDD28_2440 [Salana multivorans]